MLSAVLVTILDLQLGLSSGDGGKTNVVGTRNLISKKYKQMTFISIDVEMILPRIEFRLSRPTNN